MGADHNIHRALGHAFEGGGCGFAAVKARQAGYFHGKIGEAVGKILRVLLHQQGGGGEHGHLFAAHYRHKRGAQRDFGFAEADVAANQSVHRFALGEVFQHRADGGGLIFGFFVAEAVGKGLVILFVEGEFEAFLRRALGIKVEQFGSGVARFFGGFAFGFAPRTAAEFVQLHGVGRLAGIAADEMQLRHRHIKLRLARVFKQHHFTDTFAQIHAHQAHIAADAVFFVHHRVTDVDFGQIAQQAV